MTQEQAQKVPHTAYYRVGEEQKEVFMSFALLNRLTFIIQDISRIPMIHLMPEMREAVLVELLTERTKSGKVIGEEAQLDELDIPMDDIEMLLDWAAEHVTDFSLRVIEKATALQERNKDRVNTLKSSQDGLESKP